jgi:hypothetical protein
VIPYPHPVASGFILAVESLVYNAAFLVIFKEMIVNKDFELKNNPEYHSGHLRDRINDAIKQMRDETEELDIPQVKSMPVIPVTGLEGQQHKYFNNKSREEF